MKKLFMITLGGKTKSANIEVHDVQFIIAKNIEETFNILKENWYGIDHKLHLDAYKNIVGIDNHSVSITEHRQTTDLNLYFVNIGAYNRSMLNEIHFNKLVVSNSIDYAEKIALIDLPEHLIDIHVDNISRVDESILLNRLYDGNILLKPSTELHDLTPDWFGYKRIDKI